MSGEFEKRLGVYFNEEAILSVPKDEGSWRNWCSKGPYVKETWSSLKEQIPSELYENIQNMAARYGYSVKDELLDLEN